MKTSLHPLSIVSRIPLPAWLLACTCALASLAGCGDDPVPPVFEHHYNPVWSHDGNTVVAGVFEQTEGAAAETDRRNIVFATVATGARTSFHLAGFSPQNAMWGDTYTDYVAITVGGRIQFFTQQGTAVGAVPDVDGVTPVFVQFADSGYIWAGKRANGRWLIGMHIHDGAPQTPTKSYVLKDTVFSSDVVDVALTGGNTYAVHLAQGAVLEFTFGGLQVGSFPFPPLRKPDVWKTRLHVYRDPIFRRIYCLGDSGIVMIDLDRRTQKYVILGRIVNFDVSAVSRWLMIETTSGDVWRHSSEGTPILRMAPHHVMPSFSPNGNGFAAVGTVDRIKDTLTIRRP